MRPFAHADGCDLPRPFDELVPGLAAERDDVVVGLEDAVRELVVTHELPDILDRVELRRTGRQRHEGDVVGDGELGGHVPPGLIDDHHRMGARIDGLVHHIDSDFTRFGNPKNKPGSAKAGISRQNGLSIALVADVEEGCLPTTKLDVM